MGVDPQSRFAEYQRRRDPAVLEQLVKQYLPLALHLARRYRSDVEDQSDLDQVASLGLLKAIQRFDPARPVPFASYAVPTILGELKRHFRDRSWSVRVPRGLQELALRVNGVNQELVAELGRPPTTAEIAARAGATQEQVLEAWEASGAYRAMSLDTPPEDDDDGWAMPLGTEEPGYRQVDNTVTLDPLLRRLGDREREILRLRFAEDLTQAEIAAQVGLSQMHVSRLIRTSLERLRVGA